MNLKSAYDFILLLDDEEFRSMTMWIVSDVNTSEGRALLYSGLAHLVSHNSFF